jgi:DNA (cytosine-5)-methyltransferase 1
LISATLFSGGGLADLGLAAAGYRPAWGIEYHQPAAEIYQLNFGHNPLKDLLAAHPGDYPTPDYLHLSSPCQSFSLANTKQGERTEDLALAEKCVEFIRWHQPERLSIENVPAYKDSKSFELLVDTIKAIYPYHTVDIPDFAQFGVPQNRKRLILRASFEPISPLYFSYAYAQAADLFVETYTNWWDAIVDLVPNLVPCQLTNNQKKTIVERQPNRPYLIERFAFRRDRGHVIREAHRPCWTILAGRGGDVRAGNRTKVISLVDKEGVCRSLNIRAVARLMSLPDIYRFPENAQWHECWRVLGNGVPPLAMQVIAESFA